VKNITDILLFFCFAFFVFISCEEQELEIDNLSPSVSAKFVNADSLQKLDVLIADINEQIAQITDSSEVLDSLIDSGDPIDYSANFESLDDKEDSLKSAKSTYNSVKTTINSGLLLVDQITGSGADALTFDGDSLTGYNLPLDVRSDFSELLIEIQGNAYSVNFSYQRDTILAEGAIIIEANNLNIVNATGFDSVYFFCDTINCNSNEASATFFF